MVVSPGVGGCPMQGAIKKNENSINSGRDMFVPSSVDCAAYRLRSQIIRDDNGRVLTVNPFLLGRGDATRFKRSATSSSYVFASS